MDIKLCDVLSSASLAGWNPSFFANLLILMKSNWFDFQIDQSVLSPMPRDAKIVGQNSGTRKHRYLRPFEWCCLFDRSFIWHKPISGTILTRSY